MFKLKFHVNNRPWGPGSFIIFLGGYILSIGHHRGLLELKCGFEGLKTAKITVNRRYLSWQYLANFETVLRTSSRFFEVFT